jgi:multidrug efflux pump subunit AcrB
MDVPFACDRKRRLRPIFLTAMAAAIGVFPMILSGSPLWSPLASVMPSGSVVDDCFSVDSSLYTNNKTGDKRTFS